MNHGEALSILENIDYTKDPSIVKKELLDVINSCSMCLEAHYLLSRIESNIDEKERILLEAIQTGSYYIMEHPEEPGYQTLIKRGKIELGTLCQELGKYKKAIEVFEEIIDEEDEHLVRYHLMSLYSLIEDDKCIKLYESYKDKDNLNIRLRVPYLVYLYKINYKEEFNKIFNEININNNYLFKVLKGEIKEEDNKVDPILDEALKVLRNNAFLINSCPTFISYISQMI